MKFKFNIRREVTIIAVAIVLFGLIAFSERMKSEITVTTIQISMDNIHENHYLDEKDIMRLMRIDEENLKGANISKLNFSEIEQRIRKSPFIRNAELYSDLKGNLIVRVSLRRPVARIAQNLGPDAYIAEDGRIMPVSDKFFSRVLLITGTFVPKFISLENIYELEEGRQIMLMLNKIRNDQFWHAQIAQIDIDNNLKTVLFTQVGDEKIEFGKPDKLDTKFGKLKIFYKEILPRVGWNKYDRINVAYEGQVVAE